MKTLLTTTLLLTLSTFIYCQAPMELFGVTNNGGPDDLGGIFRTDENANVNLIQSFVKYGEKNPVNSSLIEPLTGFLYGMTSEGGVYNQGVIYEYEMSSERMIIKHSFDTILDGANPVGSLVKASNGKLYGLTNKGGNFNKGTLFEYDLSTESLQKLHDFTGLDGEAPYGSLIQSTDGNLYGMTSLGGAFSKGVIFRYNISSGAIENLKDFNTTDGFSPRGDLLEATNGLMYGFTFYGGTSTHYGTMFSFDKSTLEYTVIRDLVFANAYPSGSFIQANSGLLYGVSKTNLFEYDITTGTLNLMNCKADGTPMEGPNGEIYFTSKTALGSTGQLGTLLKYTTYIGGITIVDNFANGVNWPNFSAGTHPSNKLLIASDGLIYGVTEQGSMMGEGAIFNTNGLTNMLRGKVTFCTRGAIGKSSSDLVEVDKKLYGIGSSGTYDNGAIYSYDLVTDSIKVMVNLNFPFSSNLYVNDLDLSFVKHPNGKLYSFIYSGGAFGNGCIIEYVPGSSTYINLYDYPSISGGYNPRKSLIVGEDGLLYGVTNNKGANSYGVLFSFDLITNTFTVLHDWTDPSQTPNNIAPIQAQNGKLYGITSGTTNGDAGVIYSFDLLTNTYTEHLSLGSFGVSKAYGSFVEGLDGMLYVSFKNGGQGSIITFDPVTNTASLSFSFVNSATTGTKPGKLLVGTNGKLYGLSISSPIKLFEYDPPTATFDTKYNFSSSDDVSYDDFYGFAKICKLIPDSSDLEITEVCEASEFIKVSSISGPSMTYQWYKDGVEILNETNDTLIFATSIGDDGTYFCKVDNGCRWEYRDSVQLTVLPLPIVSAGLDQTICTDSLTTLTASGDAITYSWSGNVNDNEPFVVSSNNEYILTGVALNGCETTDTMNVSVTPDVYASNDTSVCIGSQVILQASGDAISYSWNNNVLDGIPFQIDVEQSFVLTGINAQGCVSTDTVEIYLLNLPLVIAGPDQQICSDSTTILSADGNALSYSWSGGVINGEPFVITDNGEYILTGISSDGCVNTDTLNISVSATVYAGQDTSVCEASLATLHASGNMVSYSWSHNIIDGEPFQVDFEQSYVLTGINAQGCTSTDTVEISFLTAPTVNAGPDQEVCSDSTTILIADGNALSYSWSGGVIDGEPFVITNNGEYILTGISSEGCANTDTLNIILSGTVYAGQDTSVCEASLATLHASGNVVSFSWSHNVIDGEPFQVDIEQSYVLTGVNTQGCISTDTIEVSLFLLPIVNAGTDQEVCADSTTQFIAGGNALSYSWSSGIVNGEPFVVTNNGEYILTGISTDGCINTDTLNVSISPLVNAGQDVSVCFNSAATFNATGNAISYSWSGNVVNNVPFLAETPGTYIVSGLDANGCINTDTLELLLDSCFIVWPGDTDNDFEVSTTDFFNVGLNFGGTGEPRNNISNDWTPQTASFWDSLLISSSVSNLNQVYADCNGDGLINFDDTLAVQQNYALYHTLIPSQEPSPMFDNYGTIFFTSTAQTYGANEFVTINIHAGSPDQPLEDVYGLGFDINYEATGIVPGSLNYRINDQSWIGEISLDAIRLGVDEGNGIAHIGVCRVNHTSVSSYGIIGSVTFLTSGEVGSLDLSASNALQINANGIMRDLESEVYSVSIDPQLKVSSHDKHQNYNVYPNPSHGLFNITGLIPELKYTIVVRDITGKLLLESTTLNHSHTQISILDLSVGSYILEVIDGQSVFRKQIILTNN